MAFECVVSTRVLGSAWLWMRSGEVRSYLLWGTLPRSLLMAAEALDQIRHSVMGCRQAATMAILTAGLDRASNWVDLEAPVRRLPTASGLADDSHDSAAAHFSPELPRADVCIAMAARRALDMRSMAVAMEAVDFLLMRKWMIANGHAPLVVLFEDILLFRTVRSAGSRLRLVSRAACLASVHRGVAEPTPHVSSIKTSLPTTFKLASPWSRD